MRGPVVVEAPAIASVPHAGLIGVNILIVDDSASQRSVLAGLLADWGVSVSTASSGDGLSSRSKML